MLTEDEKKFIKKFVEEGNLGARTRDLSVGSDPQHGMEVLTWRGMPVASRKLLYINGKPFRSIVLWKQHEVFEEVETYLLSLNDPQKLIMVACAAAA